MLLSLLSGREDSNFRPWRLRRHTLANSSLALQIIVQHQNIHKKAALMLLFSFVGARRLELPTLAPPAPFASQLSLYLLSIV